MRIKKVSQTTATGAQIVNGYSTSEIDGYSCDYINDRVVYSTTEEVATGETWIDGKPIYRKVFTTTVEATSTKDIDLSSLNFYEAWVDHGNSFSHYGGRSSSSAVVFYASSSDYGLCYLNTLGNLTINNHNPNPRTFYVTIKYTKASE